MTYLYILFALVTVGCLFTLKDWRSGPIWIVLVAFLQEPLRKMIPGAPSWTLLLVIPLIGLTVLGLLIRQKRFLREFRVRMSGVYQALMLFLITLIPAVLIDFSYGLVTGLMILTLAGLTYGIGCSTPLVGVYFSLYPERLIRFVFVYVCICALFQVGTIWEVSGWLPNHPLVGSGVFDVTWIRTGSQGAFPLRSGFFRSPDVLGWHSVIAFCAGVFGAIVEPRKERKYLWILFSTVCLVGVVFCGRRKFIYMIPIIGIVFCALNLTRVQGLFKWLRIIIVVFGLFSILLLWVDIPHELVLYFTGGGGDDAGERISGSTYGEFLSTFHQSGFWGKGLGCSLMGVRHLVGGGLVWQESGTGRVAVEFGVLGMIGLVNLMVRIVIAIRKGFKLSQRSMPSRLFLYYSSFSAILVGILMSFSVAAQVYSDFVVIFLLTFFLGVSLGLNFWGRRVRVRPAAVSMSNQGYLRRDAQ